MKSARSYVEGLDDSRMNVLEASLPMWEADMLGYTDARSWEKTQEILLQMGLLDAPVEDLERRIRMSLFRTWNEE